MDTQAPTTEPGPRAEPESRRACPARVLLEAAAWVVGGFALAAVFLRVSLGSRVNSDGANSVLQGWDLLHGHLLLHGWMIGDANFYFLELPLNAFTAAVFGLGNFSAHAASALTYLLVTVCAVALAMTGSRGPARLVRCLVVVIVLAAPLLTASSVLLVLEEPDHIGTSVFILGSFLLIDRLPERRFTAPLLCLILCAGEFSDLTVRYVAVPAVVLVCGYRALAARGLRSPDTALAAAALVSVPLTALMSAAMRALGGFTRDAPGDRLVPARLWPRHAAVSWMNLRYLFGAVDTRFTELGALGAALGSACLLAAAFGVARVGWAWWRVRATRAEQMLGVAIVCNLGADLITTLTSAVNPHEIAVVLPCGAVLAARALVPARITQAVTAFVAVAATALVAVLPLASAATVSVNKPLTAPLTRWLEAHHLRYGLAGYWQAAAATLQSGGRVQIRTADTGGKRVRASVYEIKSSWYDPSLHDATFVVADPYYKLTTPAAFERSFGKPAATYRVAFYTVMIYRTNLLRVLPRPWVQRTEVRH